MDAREKELAPTQEIQKGDAPSVDAALAETLSPDDGGAAVLALTPGDREARYRLGRRIGHGGMGEVFAAEDLRVGREVAVKTWRLDAPRSAGALARFLREARIQGRLEHPAMRAPHGSSV